MKRAVFLDRDGTLIEDPGYLGDARAIQLIPAVPRALERLTQAGFELVVCSNQSGVARGAFAESDVLAVNAALAELLRPHGVCFARMLYCPHHPNAGAGAFRQDCECRKPKPGMTLRAARELAVDLTKSWTVGDALRDLAAGVAAGIAPRRALLVRTGKGRREEPRLVQELGPEVRAVDDLGAAVEAILAPQAPR